VILIQLNIGKYLHGNVDASFSAHLNVVVCIRDEVGNFVKARTMWSSPTCVSDIGEALALSQAI